MGADIDISKFLHPLDLVSPVEAALHLREARENETTQRMYAQNQMARQSAADFRDERDHREKLAKEEEDRKIAQAGALKRAQQMMRSPGGLGPAQALMEAYGGHLNPLTAAVAPPPQGDAVDQLLASPEGAAAAMPAAGPGPVEGPAPAPGVQSGGMAPVTAADRLGPGGYPLEGPQQLQHAPEGDFLLPTAMHVSPGMQGAMDRQGFVPRGAEPLQPPAGPGAPAAAGDLESLMSRAAPQPTAKPEAPPMPLLYEAVMNGQHYPLGGPGASTLGLGKQYDDRLATYEAAGIDPQKARMQVIKEADDDVKAQHIADRTAASIDTRNTNQTARDAAYRLTGDQQMGEHGKNRALSASNNAASNRARIEAAGIGAGPKTQQADNAAINTFMKAAKEAKAATGSGKDIGTLKNIEKIEEELHSSSPAAQNAAVDTLAQIAQGGKASIAVMNVFQQHSVGPWQSLKDKAYQATHNGQHSPEYIGSFKEAVKGLKQVAGDQRTRAMSAYDSAAGASSQYAKNPSLAGYVGDERKAFMQELGIPDEAPAPQGQPGAGAPSLDDYLNFSRSLPGGRK